MKTALLLILASALCTIWIRPVDSRSSLGLIERAHNVKGFKGSLYQKLFAFLQQTNAPTGREIVAGLLQNKNTIKYLQKAWVFSHYRKNIYQERGGYIYANPNNPSQLQVVPAPKNAAKPFKLNGRDNPAINLEGAGSAKANKNWILVANFHTHPLLANEEPSTADLRNAFRRGVPGIVISRRSIWVYGPERRADFRPTRNPHAYPEDNDMRDFNPNARRSVQRVTANPFPALPLVHMDM